MQVSKCRSHSVQILFEFGLRRSQSGLFLARVVSRVFERFFRRCETVFDFGFCNGERALLRIGCRLRFIEALLSRSQRLPGFGEAGLNLVLRSQHRRLLFSRTALRIPECRARCVQILFEFGLRRSQCRQIGARAVLRISKRLLGRGETAFQLRFCSGERSFLRLGSRLRLIQAPLGVTQRLPDLGETGFKFILRRDHRRLLLSSTALRIPERSPRSVQTGLEFGLGRGQSGQIRARTVAHFFERLLRRCEATFEIGFCCGKGGLFGFGCRPCAVEILLGGTQCRHGIGKAIFEFGLG